MKKVIAIGGGESLDENLSIHQRVVELSSKKKPNFLFIPTASNDSSEYVEKVDEHFSKLNCICDVLYLIEKTPSQKIIEEKILKADIIYVGGGNTLRMMNIWRKNKVDIILKKAYEKGTVMSGISAGSICWFGCGNSDSRKFTNSDSDLIKVSGLGFIDALHCPHYDAEKDRKGSLKKMMKKTFRIVSVAIDNCCAIEVIDDEYRIIDSKKTAQAYKVYWTKGEFIEKEIEKKEEYQSLDELVSKKTFL